MTGGGPDLKARTDLAEMVEKADIEAKKAKQVPEQIHRQPKSSAQIQESSGLLGRVLRFLRV